MSEMSCDICLLAIGDRLGTIFSQSAEITRLVGAYGAGPLCSGLLDALAKDVATKSVEAGFLSKLSTRRVALAAIPLPALTDRLRAKLARALGANLSGANVLDMSTEQTGGLSGRALPDQSRRRFSQASWAGMRK
jgi:hypothetical protein